MNGFSAPIGAPNPSIRWYLTGTTLVLSNAADASVLSEVIRTPLTYTYEKGRWIRGTGGLVSAPGVRSGITGADFEAAMHQFLATSIPATSGSSSGNGNGTGKGNGGGNSQTTGPGSVASAQAVVNAMSNYIRLGALGPAQKANMSAPLNDLRAALLDYTQLPNGQLNKP
jgi:hypothetical protein